MQRGSRNQRGGRHMTIEELIQAAAKLDGWHVMPSGIIRRRGLCWECPITAVANDRLEEKKLSFLYNTGQFLEAGDSIGIGSKEAGAIIRAADSVNGGSLRARMFDAFGISNRKEAPK